MKFRIEVVCINDAGHEHRNDVLEKWGRVIRE